MKKTLILVLLTAVFIITVSAKVPKLTKDYLTKTSWINNDFYQKNHIKFSNTNQFSIVLVVGLVPGDSSLKGKYKIEKNTIILYDITYRAHPYGSGKEYTLDANIELQLNPLEANFYYYYALEQTAPVKPTHDEPIETLIFYDSTNAVTPGDILTVDVNPLVMIHKQAVTTSNLKVRTGPSIHEKNNTYVFDIYEDEIWLRKKLPYIPKGFSIYVLGRTKEKQKVHDWNNYWYYVYFKTGDGLDAEDQYGWVYAEFVNF